MPYEITENNAKITVRPVISINAPSPFSPTRFYQEILSKVGPYYNSDVNRLKVFELLNKIKLETLIIDEAQSIMYSRGMNVVEGLEALKDLSNNIHANIVLFGVPSLESLVQMDFQYYRRFDVKRLHPFLELNDEFLSVLRNIEEQINAPFPLGFSNKSTIIPKTLFKMSNGLISELMKAITEIFFEAGLYNPDVKLSDMKISLDTIRNVRVKTLENMDEEKRKAMLERMDRISERMLDEKLKIYGPEKGNRKKQ